MENLNGKRVLITGSTGFVGANLLRRSLHEELDVHIITRKNSNKWRINDLLNQVHEYQVDLRNFDDLLPIVSDVEPDLIFHLATYGGNPSQSDTKKILESNLFGTINLLNACKKKDFELFVNTSSSSEYGIKSEIMKEKDILEPVNDYGVSKAATTLYCQSIAKREELPITTLRLFSPYGYYEGPERLISSVILSCLKGDNPKVSSPYFVRDFIFIEDVLEAYMKITRKSNLFGDIFNIGSGVQHSAGEIINKIIDLVGNDVQPEWTIAPKWANEPDKWQADMSQAEKVLKWTPKYDLSNGLTETVKWFEEHVSLYE
jgi:nucleoside-diphosphate-sugar epimerase